MLSIRDSDWQTLDEHFSYFLSNVAKHFFFFFYNLLAIFKTSSSIPIRPRITLLIYRVKTIFVNYDEVVELWYAGSIFGILQALLPSRHKRWLIVGRIFYKRFLNSCTPSRDVPFWFWCFCTVHFMRQYIFVAHAASSLTSPFSKFETFLSHKIFMQGYNFLPYSHVTCHKMKMDTCFDLWECLLFVLLKIEHPLNHST